MSQLSCTRRSRWSRSALPKEPRVAWARTSKKDEHEVSEQIRKERIEVDDSASRKDASERWAIEEGHQLNVDRRGGIVEIPKEQILQMLRDRGDHQQAQQADQQLPDQVDPEQHGGLLGQIGIDPREMLGGMGGKLGL